MLATDALPTVDDRIPLLLLGLGNVLCQDDGAGVAALHRLRRAYALPAGVLVVDGGTLGLDLLPLVERAERVLLLDAVGADAPPGTLVRLEGDEVAPAVRERLSPHQIGVADLLGGAAILDHYPDEVVIVGVVPAATDLGLGCTPDVAASLDGLVLAAVAELAAMGFAPARFLRDDAAAAAMIEPDDIRALGL
ncbi:MAG TPA: HyaD/HybD family hydrogenase maturation endopeptidase [Kofleriaceae bacterium]|nr:HyaD/HybD family hydrogenase maturation endopeptidase [Kofleriaceae bacterium]